jgi:hypothetical protein
VGECVCVCGVLCPAAPTVLLYTRLAASGWSLGGETPTNALVTSR